MSAKSVRKRFDEPRFAAKISAPPSPAAAALGVDLDTHIANLIKFFGAVSFT